MGPRLSPFLFWFGAAALAVIADRQLSIVPEKATLTSDLEDRASARTDELDGQRRCLASIVDSLEEGLSRATPKAGSPD